MAVSPPTPKEAIESVVHRVVSFDRDEIVSDLLRRHIPSSVLSQFWGGGARLKHMKNRALARGLARGTERDKVIQSIVASALVRTAFQSTLCIRVAAKRWASPKGGPLPETALRWLAERTQPLLDDITFWSLSEERPLPRLIPGRATEVERLGTVLLADSPLKPVALLSRVRKDATGTILQCAVPLASYENEVALGHLAQDEMDDAIRTSGEPADTDGAVGAAIVCALAGDLERAAALAPEPSRLAPMQLAAMSAIRAMHALRRGHRADIEAMLAEVRPRAHLSMVSGLLELDLDRPLEAALSFAQHYATVGDPMAFGVQLAVACLEQSGERVPGWMAEIAERGYATVEERRRVEEAIEALLLREGVRHDVARASERPPALPIASEQSRLTDELGARVADILHRNLELRDHLARGDLAKVAPLAADIERLRASLDQARDALVARVSEGGRFSIPPMPDEALASDEAASAWLGQVEQAIAEHTESVTHAVEQERERLRADLEALDIEVPAEIEAARSAREVRELRSQLDREMRVAAAIRRQDAGFDIDALGALGVSERLEVYAAIARRYPSAILRRFLEGESDALLWDEGTPGLLFKVLAGVVEQESSLPPGTWEMLDNLIAGDVLAALASRDLLTPLSELSEDDLAGLDAVAGDRLELLPRATQRAVRHRRTFSLSGDTRVRELAALMRESPDDRAVLEALLDALLSEGRSSEALLLASVAARRGWLEDAGTLSKRVAIDALLDVTQRGDTELVAELLLADIGWLTSSDEEVALLAWLLRRCADLDPGGGFADALIDLRYRASSRLDSAERRFPGLMRRVFREDGHAVDQAARTALEELERDLGKPSCYSNWAEARRYQDHFRQRIEAVLVTTPIGRIDATPDELIDEAQAASGLVAVEGDARNAMRRFLCNQFERLETLRASITSFDELRHDTGQIDLAAEADTLDGASPLRRVYRALEGP